MKPLRSSSHALYRLEFSRVGHRFPACLSFFTSARSQGRRLASQSCFCEWKPALCVALSVLTLFTHVSLLIRCRRSHEGVFSLGRANMKQFPCHQVHFRAVIFPWTNPAKGNCSFLDTCRNLNRCDHIHYELDDKPGDLDIAASPNAAKKPPVPSYLQVIDEAQTLCFPTWSRPVSTMWFTGIRKLRRRWEVCTSTGRFDSEGWSLDVQSEVLGTIPQGWVPAVFLTVFLFSHVTAGV